MMLYSLAGIYYLFFAAGHTYIVQSKSCSFGLLLTSPEMKMFILCKALVPGIFYLK